MKELIKIQNDLKAPKNQRNNFGKYNYRSCEDILEALKPLLKENECTLVLVDEVKEIGGLVFVESAAVINNGKLSITVKAQAGIDTNRKGMDVAQSYGSSSSYARKYALNGLFLIDDTKEIDSVDNSKPVSKPKPHLTTSSSAFSGGIKKGTSIEVMKRHFSIDAMVEDEYNKQLKENGSK